MLFLFLKHNIKLTLLPTNPWPSVCLEDGIWSRWLEWRMSALHSREEKTQLVEIVLELELGGLI